ncbi:MAG: Uma2 family endonuclease [Gemmatimonadaceae bacterium]|nr:Uma2 family endonuclease [Gemmatimonadaceae bacterium]MCW5825604.1 Uma2 family endonuclease [Gemmatimonadaceae bacterium]
MAALIDSDWTAERWRALPDDGKRCEVLDGELWQTPSPSSRHNAVAEELYDALRPWARESRLARVRYAPADIEFSPRRVLQPDLYAIPWADQPPRDWSESRDLLLAVEVLSPATARVDRHTKRLIYQQQGVPEYWIVDVEARLVERWRPTDDRPEVIAETLAWTPVAGSPSLRIDLPALFRAALGDD